MKIIVTGSTGLVGRALVRSLLSEGHAVTRLVRGESQTFSAPGTSAVRWDPERGSIDAAALEGHDGAVHLAGESIATRWSAAQKARILESRVKGTTLLAETLAKLSQPPEVLVSGSGINFYGDRGDEILTEASRSGGGFLAEVCRQWEAATAPASDAGIRVALLRTGIVLSGGGGALGKMLLPFRLGLGGRMGSGTQWMSWISIEDEVGAIVHLLGDGAPSGPVNATSPNPVTNAEFSKALAEVLRRPAVLPVPATALRAVLGRGMADELLLGSMRVLPTRLLDSGYTFRTPDLRPALQRVLADGESG